MAQPVRASEPSIDAFVTVAELSKKWRLSVPRLRRAIRAGELLAYQVSQRCWHVRVADAEQWVSRYRYIPRESQLDPLGRLERAAGKRPSSKG